MAEAHVETMNVVVLTLTEDEAGELRALVGASDATPARVRIVTALNGVRKPQADESASPADTVEYDGRTYDLTARYKDSDGDVWRFRRRLGGGTEGHLARWRADTWDGASSLEFVVQTFGPLTRVDE
ncbi:phiSA1p31-related protein [Streptomyces tsukubensis]|uniref:phiSA1p31-related protein n=1 Tax=Streptomyces tsukubensis TaxID=83656 RepID=UPI00344FFB6F